MQKSKSNQQWTQHSIVYCCVVHCAQSLFPFLFGMPKTHDHSISLIYIKHNKNIPYLILLLSSFVCLFSWKNKRANSRCIKDKKYKQKWPQPILFNLNIAHEHFRKLPHKQYTGTIETQHLKLDATRVRNCERKRWWAQNKTEALCIIRTRLSKFHEIQKQKSITKREVLLI